MGPCVPRCTTGGLSGDAPVGALDNLSDFVGTIPIASPLLRKGSAVLAVDDKGRSENLQAANILPYSALRREEKARSLWWWAWLGTRALCHESQQEGWEGVVDSQSMTHTLA